MNDEHRAVKSGFVLFGASFIIIIRFFYYTANHPGNKQAKILCGAEEDTVKFVYKIVT